MMPMRWMMILMVMLMMMMMTKDDEWWRREVCPFLFEQGLLCCLFLCKQQYVFLFQSYLHALSLSFYSIHIHQPSTHSTLHLLHHSSHLLHLPYSHIHLHFILIKLNKTIKPIHTHFISLHSSSSSFHFISSSSTFRFFFMYTLCVRCHHPLLVMTLVCLLWIHIHLHVTMNDSSCFAWLSCNSTFFCFMYVVDTYTVIIPVMTLLLRFISSPSFHFVLFISFHLLLQWLRSLSALSSFVLMTSSSVCVPLAHILDSSAGMMNLLWRYLLFWLIAAYSIVGCFSFTSMMNPSLACLLLSLSSSCGWLDWSILFAFDSRSWLCFCLLPLPLRFCLFRCSFFPVFWGPNQQSCWLFALLSFVFGIT